MKKIQAHFAKTRSMVSMKRYKRPMLFVILMMLVLNIVILFIAAFITNIIDDSYDGVIDAFANGSLKWMLTPNAILSITETNTLIVAVSVLIIGMILFTGTIIALTTNLIKDYFQSRRSGSGKIYLSGHVVILNWNNKVPELVADLMHIEGDNITVAVLADIDKAYAEKQILNAINKNEHAKQLIQNLNVLVKQGDPLIQSDLDDISISEAISIIIMNRGLYEDVTTGLTKSDLNIIKVILNIGRIQFKLNPPVVAEIKRIETKEKIATMKKVVASLHEMPIIPICFDRRLGQIISQTIIHNLMEDVYLSMFSFEGSEVYFLENTTFEYCLKYHTDAIPLARKGSGVFVLALNDKKMTKKSTSEVASRILNTKVYKEATSMNVFILGKNNKLEFILSSFSEYEKLYGTDFKATWIESSSIHELVKELNGKDEEVTIVLLSEEGKDPDALDANVIDQLIYLEGHLKRKNVDIIVELLDPKNDVIIKDFNINNTIISDKIISLLLSKMALFQNTESFYENLLTLEINEDEEDDQEVFIREAKELYDEPFPLVFDTKKSFVISHYESYKQRMIPFGIFHDGRLEMISENLHDIVEFTVEETDLIVLMKL